LNEQYRPHSVNVAQLWPILFPHTVGGRCLDGIGAAMVRAPTNGQMRASKERNAHACAKYSMMCQKSTVETIRNNQAIRGSYNGIVIMQTTQAAFHKQRKRDSANNANVIMAKHMAHNAIVISSSHGQAFVTFRNISSAYHSHKLSLSIASGRPDTNTDHDHGLIRIRIIIRLRYEYGLKSKNLGGGLAGKIDQGA